MAAISAQLASTQAPPRAPSGRAPASRVAAGSGLRQASPPPPVHITAPGETSNVLALNEGHRRKLELQAEVQAMLAADNAWWQDAGDAPANVVSATSPRHFKALVTGAVPNQLVLVDYLKPSCSGCRRLHPKLLQIAAANPDALFIKVNVDADDDMRALGEGMQVAQLPWFHLFLAGDLVASFSANLSTVARLRAELAAHKPCEASGCVEN